jgi:DNA adenine methylase
MRTSAARSAQVIEDPYSREARPFLKWVGGKGQLLAQFRTLLPTSYNRYYEPFIGGGALFFAVRPKRASLSDINGELIDCYRAIRDSVEAVIVALRGHRYEKDYYYSVRTMDPSRLGLPARAARTIFLNRSGFNGLYRVNQRGQFNVPFGRYTNPRLCDPENLRACAEALLDLEIEQGDFALTTKAARRGDFVYFDPPYVPVSGTANFTRYAAGQFGELDQQRLAATYANLSARGVLVMLSNSDTPIARDLYRGFQIDRVAATRSINSNPDRRGKVSEVVVRNFD